MQEAGHIRLVQSHAGTQRSSLGQLSDRAGRGRQRQSAVRRAAVCRCGAGQCFWIDCRRPHGYRSADADPWELRWVHFNGRSAPAFYRRFGEEPVFTPGRRRGSCAAASMRCWPAQAAGTRRAELEASAEIAALLAGILGGQVRVGAPGGESGQAARLEAVRAYLADHCAEPLTLDELAARFFVSKYYLARSFKQRYGETILDCLHAARIDRAKQMLRYTDQTLAQDRGRLRLPRAGLLHPPLQIRRRPNPDGIPQSLAGQEGAPSPKRLRS